MLKSGRTVVKHSEQLELVPRRSNNDITDTFFSLRSCVRHGVPRQPRRVLAVDQALGCGYCFAGLGGVG